MSQNLERLSIDLLASLAVEGPVTVVLERDGPVLLALARRAHDPRGLEHAHGLARHGGRAVEKLDDPVHGEDRVRNA
jgi:hypothetical protein